MLIREREREKKPNKMSAPISHPTQGPPVPPAKPVLSSPGAYMANFSNNSNSSGSSTVVTPTAGIHSVNKNHEKPAIAARPIPPPTLPKYSSSFSKSDRDRNEFAGKLDRVEREKVDFTRSNFFHNLYIYKCVRFFLVIFSD